MKQGLLVPLTHVGARVLAAVLLLTTALFFAPSRSEAAGDPASVLCSGYVACNQSHFSSHGYQHHSGASYWYMYAGNNCTNYVAFVETSVFGVATPSYRLGDAGQWPATATLHGVVVNHIPTVGSVAEWNGGSPGIPSPGHVAVVEAVGPHRSYIEISQQNILDADNYDWTRINADGAGNLWEQWPSNFVHFPVHIGSSQIIAGPVKLKVAVQTRPLRFGR
jgi:surface antigen